MEGAGGGPRKGRVQESRTEFLIVERARGGASLCCAATLWLPTPSYPNTLPPTPTVPTDRRLCLPIYPGTPWGTRTQVRWKAFAIAFDEIAPSHRPVRMRPGRGEGPRQPTGHRSSPSASAPPQVMPVAFVKGGGDCAEGQPSFLCAALCVVCPCEGGTREGRRLPNGMQPPSHCTVLLDVASRGGAVRLCPPRLCAVAQGRQKALVQSAPRNERAG